MTSQNITIIDTGCANLSSVVFALRRLGIEPVISNDEAILRKSDKLILPGVGTAQAAMKNLKERNLPEIIKSLNKPLLGICLGMQMLAQFSDESMVEGEIVNCLGIVNGGIKLLQAQNLPLPHMGWNQVFTKKECPLFKDIKDGSYFYFVHSYALEVSDDTAATSNYGQQFTAVVQKDNFFGAQFHPEKSGAVGAKFLENFIKL
jgi:glutamine amidotransferase